MIDAFIEGRGFFVDIKDTNSPIPEDETLEVETEIINLENGTQTKNINLVDFNGVEQDDEDISLNFTNSTVETFTWDTDENDAGIGEVTVSSENYSDSTNVIVAQGFFVEIVDAPTSVTEGEDINVDVEVTNALQSQASRDITLTDFDGDVQDTRENVSLSSGDSTTVNLTWRTMDGDAGSGDVTVSSENYSDSRIVTVNADDGGGGGTTDLAAQFTVSSRNGNTVTFDASGSSDDGTITSYDWDFGDGSAETTTDDMTTHTFPSSGEYTVTLEVTDDDDNNDTTTDTVSVGDGGSGPSFSIEGVSTNSPVTEGESIQIDVSVVNNGNGSGTQNVVAEVANIASDSKQITLDPNESTTVSLTIPTSEGDANSYTLTVSSQDDSKSKTITVEEAPRFRCRRRYYRGG